MKNNGIKTLSLFSGAGGLDLGFQQAGFDILACVEIEEKYCRTLEKNRESGHFISQSTKIHNIDIKDFDATEYKDLDIECIIGGPPCQTFSAAGRRAGGVIGVNDDRGQLYSTYCDILDTLKPKVFVFENVYGLKGANGGKPWEEISQAFSERGYNLHAEVLDAADYGVPQHRERLIMVGTKTGEFRFPAPVVGPDSSSGKPLVSVIDAIGDLQDENEEFSLGLGGLYGHLLPDVPEGLNYAFFTAEMGHPEPVFAWRSKFHDLLYKVKQDSPCRTIKANPGKFTGPFHWKNRHFTLDELKRLQTFPDSYELVGSYGKVVEQIGNSVPPALARVIAYSVKEQLLRPSSSLSFQVRDSKFKSTFRQRQRERSKEFKIIAKRAIKKKYGELAIYDNFIDLKPRFSKYFSEFNGFFERSQHEKKPKADNHLAMVLTESARFIRLDVDEKNKGETATKIKVDIVIEGLKKYLPDFDNFKLSANIASVESIFHLWKEIEITLTSRSKFFTLIDIYGHYANRGDVISVKSEFSSDTQNPFFNMINYFSQTANCGSFVSEKSLEEKFQITNAELQKYIILMRELRYDIRTPLTHPIMQKGLVLCTYPFPLLSPKALVASKVKINQGREYDFTSSTA